MKRLFFLTAILGLVVCSASSFGQESKNTQPSTLTVADLPAPVQATLQREFPHSRIAGVSKADGSSGTRYTITAITKGRSKNVVIDPTGRVLQTEEATKLSAIAPAARKVIARFIAGKKSYKITVVRIPGGVVGAYAAETGEKEEKRRIRVAPGGNLIPE